MSIVVWNISGKEIKIYSMDTTVREMIVEDKLQLIMAKMIAMLSTKLYNFFPLWHTNRPFVIGKIFQCCIVVKWDAPLKYTAALLTNINVGVKDLP